MARRNKRASMREGPLADLFRSTADEGLSDEAVEPAEEHREPEQSRHRSEPEPQVSRGVEPPAAAEPVISRPDPVEQVTEPVIDEPEQGEIEVYRREEAPAPEAPAPEAPAPSAPPERKERLREFFTEVPDNVMAEEPDPRRLGSAPKQHRAMIRVVGVGGAGVNAINRMVEAGIPGVEFMAINTDLQSLQQSTADVTVHIGVEKTNGLGSGSNPELGYEAAFAEQDKIKRLLKGSDMVVIAAGAGGGTGTGAAPFVAKLAHDVGALTVGIVTKPFAFEGTRRAKQAEDGIRELAGHVDTLIVVPNQKLISILERNTSMVEAFRVADDVLRQGVQGISDLVTLPGLINLDFADVRTIMKDGGRALLGIGMSAGENRAVNAAHKAVSSPLLEVSMDGARSLLLSITGGRDLSLIEVSEAANIIFGANIDEDLDEQVWVTVVATRFDDSGARRARVPGTRESAAARHRGPSRAREVTSGELGVDVPEFLNQ
jgi:cell division protein FtsZ